ncbi:glycerol-3-phosphate 1-O-acyltransferase [Paraconexibacter antarcticus]|uniref:Glycerol-3-phosphate 1-O-acyltransferase n=1 Tax=Paraconexibacter antarcticus TaxID=2949664 RepID=A0ABY5DUS0_9ACTN|nr:glycerol-3-phosphate 1-O-acyltransferase [Paraconexibacter antarcticus]UTI64269.1 glycerol-3-phosphate 1-O-acyltransferase [Paraconexibacter antarcticus]
MATVTQTPPATGDPVVLLVDARTGTERELIDAWAREHHPGAETLDRAAPELRGRLERGDDPLVLPVRVTWLPRERDGDRTVRVADLLALTNPHRPWGAVQKVIARREPDRARVTAGEPAHALELRRRFREHAGRTAGGEAFAAFVARQAELACERAERQIVGDRYKVPRLVAEQITASHTFRTKVSVLAEKLDRPFEEVLAEATDCLQEVAAVQSRPAIDAFRAVMRPMHANAWDVDVDSESLERLRELNRRHPLVFLPSHRSYADPLVLAQVLHDHDFPRNHVLGGANMAFWPIGPLGKRAGIIFIRRTFGDDQVYKLAVREYLAHLAAKRFNIEWYLEGGRTRTGKLRPPKFGLLAYLAKALDDPRVDDVMLVPVSMVYDQLHEVGAMAAEQGGAKKQSEGLKWFANYINAQRSNSGTAQVRFGDPFSLKGALEEAGEGRAQLEKVAFRICDGINRATPLASTSLVTLALLGVRDRALTLDQVMRVLTPLLDHVAWRRIPGTVDELRRPASVRGVLDALENAGVVSCYEGGTEPVWQIAEGRHHVAAFYRNGALHHFIIRAIVELALVRLSQHPPEPDAALTVATDDALALRDLLKFEFFFGTKRAFLEEMNQELENIDPEWQQRIAEPGGPDRLLAGRRTLVADRALRSFFDAQLVVAEQLAATPSREAVDQSAFIDRCLGVGRQMVLQGRLHGPESVSQELFAAAMRLAANRDVVDPGRDDVRVAREAWRDEVREIRRRLVRIGELDAKLLEGVLYADAA